MPLHTPPPSGNRRHLTSANAGAFITPGPHFQAVTDGNRSEPIFDAMGAKKCGAGASRFAGRGGCKPVSTSPKSKEAVHQFRDRDGRPATRSFDCRHTPSPAAWRAVSYANPSQAHAATRLHGADQ